MFPLFSFPRLRLAAGSASRLMATLAPTLAAALPPAQVAAADPPPNVVLILCDDLGYADLGCQGARDFATPHLDRMAAEGVRLTEFYVPASVCSASRAALLTGCYPDRVGVTGEFSPTRAANGQPPGPGKEGLHPDEVTLAERLRSRGYATACVGNWHLGDHRDFLPTRQGFDEYFGIPYANDLGRWEGQPEAFRKDFPPLPLFENEDLLETNPDQRELTRRYTERAEQFLRRQSGRPFFLYLAHAMPHVPLFVSGAFSGRADYGLYGDVIEELDAGVGRILSVLEELKLSERTLVIFTSDNGPWLSQGAHGGKADPLRDGKFTQFEGGHRVPCLMRWPGRIPAATVRDGMAASIDLLPTLVALAGAAPDAASDRPLDGLDLWPYLSGRADRSPRETFFYSPRVVRRGEWKLMMPGRYREFFPPPENHPPGAWIDYDHPRLFHLPTDIGERRSLHGRSEYQPLIAELTRLCLAYEEELKTAARPTGRVP